MWKCCRHREPFLMCRHACKAMQIGSISHSNQRQSVNFCVIYLWSRCTNITHYGLVSKGYSIFASARHKSEKVFVINFRLKVQAFQQLMQSQPIIGWLRKVLLGCNFIKFFVFTVHVVYKQTKCHSNQNDLSDGFVSIGAPAKHLFWGDTYMYNILHLVEHKLLRSTQNAECFDILTL